VNSVKMIPLMDPGLHLKYAGTNPSVSARINVSLTQKEQQHIYPDLLLHANRGEINGTSNPPAV
ncbi:hypothetical protein KUCAC02_033221, partial [Chaenocephalus aceratus]